MIKNRTQDAIDKLRSDEEHNNQKIKRIFREKEGITGLNDDGEEQQIDPNNLKVLDLGCADVFKTSK